MGAYQFVVIVGGMPAPGQADALLALPDRPVLTRLVREGTGRVRFTRRAGSLAEAVVSAVRDVEAVGLRPMRLVHDDWVTLADIAALVDRSRETVRLWSIGRLGPGGFPPPVNPGRDTSFYSWVEVSGWLRERAHLTVRRPEPTLVAADLAVRLRVLAPRVGRMAVLRDLSPW